MRITGFNLDIILRINPNVATAVMGDANSASNRDRHVSSYRVTGSSSSLSPSGLRGEHRLRREVSPWLWKEGLPHPTHQGCVNLCGGEVRVLWITPLSCRKLQTRRDVSRCVRVIVCCICFCGVGGVFNGEVCVLGCPLRCCRECMCRSL